MTKPDPFQRYWRLLTKITKAARAEHISSRQAYRYARRLQRAYNNMTPQHKPKPWWMRGPVLPTGPLASYINPHTGEKGSHSL